MRRRGVEAPDCAALPASGVGLTTTLEGIRRYTATTGIFLSSSRNVPDNSEPSLACFLSFKSPRLPRQPGQAASALHPLPDLLANDLTARFRPERSLIHIYFHWNVGLAVRQLNDYGVPLPAEMLLPIIHRDFESVSGTGAVATAVLVSCPNHQNPPAKQQPLMPMKASPSLRICPSFMCNAMAYSFGLSRANFSPMRLA